MLLTLSFVIRCRATVVRQVLHCRSGTSDYIGPFNRLLVTQQVVAEYKHASSHYLCVHKHTP